MLAALPPPFSLIRLDEVESTNDEARRRLLDGAAVDLLVIQADRQSQGRGRRGRTWISPAGNLFFSLLIDIDGRLPQAAQLGFAAAVALVQTFRDLVPTIPFTCKWPNDVLAEGRKCSGMLLEPAEVDWLILGIGVNVAVPPPPQALTYPACALADLGYAGDASQVLAGFCHHFNPLLAHWRDDDFPSIRRCWLDHARGVGEPVVVRLEHDTLAGVFAGLDGEGALLLDQGADGVRRIMAGDVYFPDAGGRSTGG